jgi:hypothetical protein
MIRWSAPRTMRARFRMILKATSGWVATICLKGPAPRLAINVGSSENTLAERGSPSIAAISPTVPPAAISAKLTSRPLAE